MSYSQRDKTISHHHGDPKFIQQANAKTTLSVGQFVFLDIDGIYKPAISLSEQYANVMGYVWSLVDDGFYLKMGSGPMEYRFPLSQNFVVPGLLGDEVYLSATISGGMQTTAPSAYPFIVGYKTDYGMLYRPDPIFCCTGIITAAPIPPSVPANLFSIFDLFKYTYDCTSLQWVLTGVTPSYIFGGVPSSLINVALSGNVTITGGNVQYIACISGTPTISASGPVPVYQYQYQTDGSCKNQTIIEPVVVFGTIDELFNCSNGILTNRCPFVLPTPTLSLSGVAACCPSGSTGGTTSVSCSGTCWTTWTTYNVGGFWYGPFGTASCISSGQTPPPTAWTIIADDGNNDRTWIIGVPSGQQCNCDNGPIVCAVSNSPPPFP